MHSWLVDTATAVGANGYTMNGVQVEPAPHQVQPISAPRGRDVELDGVEGAQASGRVTTGSLDDPVGLSIELEYPPADESPAREE